MTIAEFKHARAQLGMTQAQVAALLEVSIQGVQHWEQGRRPVPEYAAKAVVTALRHRSTDVGE